MSLLITVMQYQLEDPKPTSDSKSGPLDDDEPALVQEASMSRSQQDKVRKLRRKAQVVVDHVDIIKDEFWERRPWILSGKPGKLPAEA